ncbi:fibronectin type III domain-containing protein [Haloferula sargassicola]|uniref:Fibronectin type III domain protein n=1 Tax=Haloferula sargassicola TaxID=490096 RepID=A0ABP9UMQ8_9BACT
MKPSALSRGHAPLGWLPSLIAAAGIAVVGGQELLLREVVSRETSIAVASGTVGRQIVSREVSIHVERGADQHQAISRELAVAVGDDAVPPAVDDVGVTVSPTGGSVSLDWTAYNPWRYHDIGAFRIYLSDSGPITDVSGLTPLLVVDGETTTATLDGLTEFTDHFIAIVAVDSLGHFESAASYSAAYVISPESLSREVSLFVGKEPADPYRSVVSREIDLAVVPSTPPPAIDSLAVSVSPTGSTATLDWSGYNQWLHAPIDRFEVYLSDTGPIGDVSGLTPFATARGGTTGITLDGLAGSTDHFFAVVPVDAAGGSIDAVEYAAAYVVSPEAISREVTVFIGEEPPDPYRVVVSREAALLVFDSIAPAPVTGLGSGFFVETSTTEFGAVVLDFTTYNETAQLDVTGYDVYVGNVYFDDVTGLTPFAHFPAGDQRVTLGGLPGGAIRHFAVVAVDGAGNFDPTVRSYSAQASISGVGEAVNLAAASGADSLTFSWEAPPDAGAFLQGYRIYFGSSGTPVELPLSTTIYEATGLEPGHGYPFRIATVDVFGNESSGTSIQGATLLPNPDDLFLTADGPDLVVLWSPVQPGALVKYYALYVADSPISDVSALTPVSIWYGASATPGTLSSLNGKHFAVATVNVLDAFSPTVTSVQASKLAQTIDFPTLTPAGYELVLAATASSGLPVRFEAGPSPVVAVEGNTLVASQGGQVTVTAIQDGDAAYWPAEASQAFRFPPRITRFTADGVELATGSRLIRESSDLQVTALDVEGIDHADFSHKAPGEPSFTVLSTDNTPGNGLHATLPLSLLPAGGRILRVEVFTASGAHSAREVEVVLAPQPVLSLTLGDTVVEGDSLSGSVAIGQARADDLEVTLASSNPGQLSPGPPVIIPAGELSAPLTVRAVQDDVPEAPLTLLLTATAPEAVTDSTPVTIVDDDIPNLTLTLDRSATLETAGDAAAMATLTRDRVTPSALSLALSNSLPDTISIPPAVSFPANSYSVSFPIAAIDNDTVDGSRFPEIQASLRFGSTVAATSNAVTLEVGDDEGPVLTLLAEPAWLIEGGSREAVVQRSAADLSSPLAVSLESTLPSRIAVPATVVIPANESDAIISITAPDDGLDLPAAEALVTATAGGFAPGQLSLTVNDEPLPDLVVTSVSAPAEIETESTFPLTYTLANTGATDAVTPLVQRIYLSSDPFLDATDTLLQQDSVNLTLAAGENIVRTLSLRAPRDVGSLYFLIEADAPRSVGEFFENNNVTPAPGPTEIVAAYSAVVSAAETVAPANQLIGLNGSATLRTGGPAAFVEVRIHLRNGGVTRVISAMTRADGTFAATWNPAPNEGGVVEIGATHPGASGFEVQDSFEILAIEAEGIPTDPLGFDSGASRSFTATLSNPSGTDLSNLAIHISDVPAGVTVSAVPSSSSLPGGGSIGLLVAAEADPGFSGTEDVRVTVTSDEGVTFVFDLTLEIRALTADLVVQPRPVRASVIRGGQAFPEFTLRNAGGIDSGPVEIALPPGIAFLSVATATPLPSIPPGGTRTVTLQLAPPDDTALTVFEGSLAATPENGSAITIPFAFRTVSDLTGDLEIDVVDEFSFWGAGLPHLAGASVVLRDAITSEEIATADTGADGLATFSGLTEGWYTLDVSADDHQDVQQNVYVAADLTTREQVFLTRQSVTYTWTVEETELQDRYKIEVETTFETNVPAPVVTVTPNKLDVSDLETLGQSKVVNFIIENHGLINADSGSFTFGSHPFYRITPLIEDIGTLAAKTAVVVPVTVTRIGVFDGGGGIQTLAKKSPRSTSVPCTIGGGYRYTYKCGPHGVEKGTPVAVSGVQGQCGGGAVHPVGAAGPGGSIFAKAVSFSSKSFCDCPPFLGSERCVEASAGISVPGVVSKFTSKLASVLPAGVQIKKVDFSLNGTGKLCVCCVDGQYDVYVTGDAGIDVTVELFYGLSAPSLSGVTTTTGTWQLTSLSIDGPSIGVTGTVKGSIRVGREKECLKDGDVCVTGSLSGSIFAGPKAAANVSAIYLPSGTTYSGEVSASYGITLAASVTGKWCANGGGSLQACASAKVGGSISGEVKAESGDTSASLGISIPLPTLIDEKICTGGPGAKSRLTRRETKDTGDDPSDPGYLDDAGAEPVDFSDVVEANARLIGLPEIEPMLPENADGVCARVKVKISQEAVTTRTAFNATLELANNDDAPLTDVGFDLDVRDLFGQPAGDHFNVRVTRLDGIDAIDGSGSVAAGSSGSARWTLIPRDTAAPVDDTVYLIGGTIRYVQDGLPISVPVSATPITVSPDAALSLKYFHQRDVISDDPHTDPVEPAVPYYLAVQVTNSGAGAARNLSITSAQPEIVENEKGLLIDFNILSTQVDDLPADPTLSAQFGDIAAGSSKTAVWAMESSLQGLFIDYQASFEHVDGYGDPRISLIKNVEIHEMIRKVQALDDLFDGRPDFLTNDVPDLDDFPDTIHLSDGSVESVALLEAATVAGNLPTLTLSIPPQTGWTYLRIADPGNGRYKLQSVVRSDGLTIPVDENVWLSDRTFVGLGQRPLRENILHLVDHDSTGLYTLGFVAVDDADTSPPESALRILPGALGSEIALNWSGTDTGTGIAFYDIWVSENGAPPSLWLPATRRTSALFPGTDGTHYGFYSIATDRAGNVEPAPSAPDAALVLNTANQAPVIAPIADPSVVEGRPLQLRVSASDPDGPGSGLRFSVQSPAPSLTIDAASGRLSYVTAEGDGSRDIPVTVTVADSGHPPASSSASFMVHILPDNTPPVLAAIPPQSLEAGGVLIVDAAATDADSPAQSLAWSLGPDAPSGMTIDPATGVIVWTTHRSLGGQTLTAEVIVTDSGTPAASVATTLVVELTPAPDRAPEFSQIPIALWTQGRTFSLELFASDSDDDPITLQARLGAFPAAGFADAGDGSGTFTWDTSGIAPGTYRVPVSAVSNGATTGGFIDIRIEENNVYWDWAIDEFGSDFSDPGDLPLVERNADPDGDHVTNLHEMAFLTDPNRRDRPQVEITGYERTGSFGRVDLRIHRRRGSESMVRMLPRRNGGLETGWQAIPMVDWTASSDAAGDDDGRPETERVDFSIYEFYPSPVPDRSFYRIESEEIPPP